MKDTTWAVLSSAVLAGTMAAGMLAITLAGDAGAAHGPHADVLPCPTEDSAGPCYWSADHQGNGRGMSFVVDANGDVWVGDVRDELARIARADATRN